jgi:Carboxypeptidase regulatory-like domain
MGSRMLRYRAVGSLVCLLGVWPMSCRSGGALVPESEEENAKGTLSGTVSGADAAYPVAGRLVEAVDVKSGNRFRGTTNVDGHYTLLLPPGTYEIQVALAQGEAVARQPPPVAIEGGGLVTGIDVTLGGAGVVQPTEH